MAKNRYPVIDYMECAECGACVKKCSHGVYDKSKAPSPLVVTPENCVDHCHGCGNLCPNGAITYVGEDTGWTPPHGMKTDDEPCCAGANTGVGCSCGDTCGCGGEAVEKELFVDFLYLDLKTCDRCIGTDDVLLEAVNEIEPVLKAAGYAIALNKMK
jgi:NAD-dependent dihydropyrimidine dehydrogenase PreA subunit